MPTKKRFTDDSYQKEPSFRALVAATHSCKTPEDLANFLGDIGTLSELQAWSERLEVAKHLALGLSYRQVAAATGASTTTVTRVGKSIENGTGGYRKVLKVHRHHRMKATPRLLREIVGVSAPSEADSQPQNQLQGQAQRHDDAQPQSTAIARPAGAELLQKFLEKKQRQEQSGMAQEHDSQPQTHSPMQASSMPADASVAE